MPTADQCRARAEEAERLARIVSYERDRTRLLIQVKEWRDEADRLDAQAPAAAPLQSPPGVASHLRRWLGLTR